MSVSRHRSLGTPNDRKYALLQIAGSCFLGLCFLTSTTLAVVLLAALGQSGWEPISGGARVQLIRLALYPLALAIVAAFALMLHMAVRVTMGTRLDRLWDFVAATISHTGRTSR